MSERRDLRDTRAFRREAGEAPVLGTLTALDVTAKHLIAVSGVLIAVYFHVAFAGLTARVSAWTHVLYLAPTVLLVACLVSSLLVFFPDHTPRGRLVSVRLASIFLALGVMAIALVGIAYLRG